MKKSRRDFIKGSAAIGVIGVTEASAQPARRARPGRRAMPANPKVCVLHTTSFDAGDDQGKAFLQGLADNGVTIPPSDLNRWRREAKGNYEKLQRTGKQLITREKADLIVAAGGLISAVAVAEALQNSKSLIPFVYLIGHYPASGEGWDIFLNSANKVGGVNQDTPNQNENNWKALIPGPPPDNSITMQSVALVVNDNAAMSEAESDLWLNAGTAGNRHDKDSVVHFEGYNTDADLPKLFTDIANLKLNGQQAKGLVVSADSYFRSVPQFDQRLRAAGFTGRVCYPYSDFQPSPPNSIKSPTTPSLAASGDPNAAYYWLGKVTAAYLNGNTNPGAFRWNGGAWVAQTAQLTPSRKRRRQ